MGWAQRHNEKSALKKAGALEPKKPKPLSRYRQLKQTRLEQLIEKTRPSVLGSGEDTSSAPDMVVSSPSAEESV